MILAIEAEAQRLTVERLAEHWPDSVDEYGDITCRCTARVDGFNNGWWKHVLAALAHPEEERSGE